MHGHLQEDGSTPLPAFPGAGAAVERLLTYVQVVSHLRLIILLLSSGLQLI